jgi:hypothetical protein
MSLVQMKNVGKTYNSAARPFLALEGVDSLSRSVSSWR